MQVDDKELKCLVQEKHRLERRFDKRELDEDSYLNERKSIDTRIEEGVRKHIQDIKLQQEGENNMETENKEAEKPKVVKKRGDSDTVRIIAELKKKSVNNLDAVVDRVAELNPERDPKRIKSQTKTIIGLVKKQSPDRWKKYTWDAEKFLLTENE